MCCIEYGIRESGEALFFVKLIEIKRGRQYICNLVLAYISRFYLLCVLLLSSYPRTANTDSIMAPPSRSKGIHSPVSFLAGYPSWPKSTDSSLLSPALALIVLLFQPFSLTPTLSLAILVTKS